MTKKAQYEYYIDGTNIHILRAEKPFLKLPASASVNGIISELQLTYSDENSALFSDGIGNMTFDFQDDCIVVSYHMICSEDTQIYEAKMFRAPESGIDLKDFDRAFAPQPRNNKWNNMDYFNHLPDISLNGYFLPPTFNFSIGNKDGWVSFGLLDIPDTSICKMDDDYSFLVESCGGNKRIKKGESYSMPRVIITFPADEFSAVALFRQKLIDFDLYTPKKKDFSELPAWWRNPFVCTYGDQMLEKKVGPYIDEEWVTEFVNIAEKEWGLSNINLIIDDSWQLPLSLEPIENAKVFPDFRRFIDGMHARGHHVILWCTPMFDNIGNGFQTRTQRLNVLSDYCYVEHEPEGYFARFGPECYAIDYTADNAEQFIREFCEKMFGSGEGQFNADGVKLDFMARLRNPAVARSYSHPERGIGATELLKFYQMFSYEAKKVKPDVIIDCTTGDPRFESYIDFNRLHDTHCGTREKEIRANLSALACPELPMDSDGALMFTSWLKHHYISAAVYSVPSMYYMKKFHDFDKLEKLDADDITKIKHDLSSDEKKQLGNLLSLSRFRSDGIPVMLEFGNWVLKDGDKINAASLHGETVVYYPTEKNDTGYIFTWQDETIIIPLYGRKFSELSPSESCRHLLVDYARDRVIMRITPGIVYTFKDADDGTSIERIFSEKKSISVETVMNYVND